MRGLSLVNATVDLPDGTQLEKASVTVRRGALVVKVGRGREVPVAYSSTTVTAVAHPARRLWELATGEGIVLVKDNGCGCS